MTQSNGTVEKVVVVVVRLWFSISRNNGSVMLRHCLQIYRTFIQPKINDTLVLLQLLAALLRQQAVHLF